MPRTDLISRGTRTPSLRRMDLRTRASRWLGRLAQRRMHAKGLDLPELTLLPEAARLPLLRRNTDPVFELAELRSERPVHRIDLPFGFAVHLVTGYEQARAVLADRTSYSNDIRHLFRDAAPGSAADVGGLGFADPPLHTRLRKLVPPSSPAAGWSGWHRPSRRSWPAASTSWRPPDRRRTSPRTSPPGSRWMRSAACSGSTPPTTRRSPGWACGASTPRAAPQRPSVLVYGVEGLPVSF